MAEAHALKDNWTQEQVDRFDSWSKEEIYVEYVRATELANDRKEEIDRLWKELKYLSRGDK